MPGYRTKRGKWHLSGRHATWPEDVVDPARDGYDEFSGTVGNLGEDFGGDYYNWSRATAVRGQGWTVEPCANFATNEVAAAATLDVLAGVELVHASFHAVHMPYAPTPPDHEPPGQVYSGGNVPQRRREYLLHLDYRLGDLIREAVLRDYVVFFVADNGSANHLGKGSLYERGLCTPMFVVGNGVPAGSTKRLVGATPRPPTRAASWTRSCPASWPFRRAPT
jgi:arylsulfatase A-like enzyme